LQLLPGPEAQQLATYLGWLLHRTAGGLVAGILFVLPGALVMLGLSILYAVYGNLPLVGAVFFGVKAAVLAIVVDALLRIGRRALRNRALIGIAAAAFVAIYVLDVPFPLIVLGAALIGPGRLPNRGLSRRYVRSKR
jgi:chromate transporter